MTCMSILALGAFLELTGVNISITDNGIVVHAEKGDVQYEYDPVENQYCYNRNIKDE